MQMTCLHSNTLSSTRDALFPPSFPRDVRHFCHVCVHLLRKSQPKKIHDIHVEVLKRADGLLSFLADHGMVSDKHLDLLWAAGRGQPDAQVCFALTHDKGDPFFLLATCTHLATRVLLRFFVSHRLDVRFR